MSAQGRPARSPVTIGCGDERPAGSRPAHQPCRRSPGISQRRIRASGGDCRRLDAGQRGRERYRALPARRPRARNAQHGDRLVTEKKIPVLTDMVTRPETRRRRRQIADRRGTRGTAGPHRRPQATRSWSACCTSRCGRWRPTCFADVIGRLRTRTARPHRGRAAANTLIRAVGANTAAIAS